jgi:hypothetical protein
VSQELLASCPGSKGEGKGEPDINCVRMRLINVTWLQQTLHHQHLNGAILDSETILFNGGVQSSFTSLIGHLSIKINAYLLLLREVKNIEWGQEHSVSYCSTNTAHSLPAKPSSLDPSRSSAEHLPGLNVKYMDSIRKISDFPKNLGKLSACARNWY